MANNSRKPRGKARPQVAKPPPAATAQRRVQRASPRRTPARVDDGPARRRYRAVWVSDVHLGSPGCKAAALTAFLDSVDCEKLYLVGDILDMWKLRSSFYWTPQQSAVVGQILDKAERGTRVTYIAGNHDAFLRPFLVRKLSWRLIQLADEVVHETARGQRLLVTHGDGFDAVTTWGFGPLSMAGDIAYTWLMRVNAPLNAVRGRLGMPYWSASAWAKHQTKRAVSYLSGFDEAVAHACRSRGLDGAICGHTHTAEIRTVGNRYAYYNCGDWVESCTALVEDEDGRLELLQWPLAADRMHGAGPPAPTRSREALTV